MRLDAGDVTPTDVAQGPRRGSAAARPTYNGAESQFCDQPGDLRAGDRRAAGKCDARGRSTGCCARARGDASAIQPQGASAILAADTTSMWRSSPSGVAEAAWPPQVSVAGPRVAQPQQRTDLGDERHDQPIVGTRTCRSMTAVSRRSRPGGQGTGHEGRVVLDQCATDPDSRAQRPG